MDKYRIYRNNNYIVINNTTINSFFYGTTQGVIVDKNNTNKPIYNFYNVKNFSPDVKIKIEQIYKEDSTPYTEIEFDDFYTQNTAVTIDSSLLQQIADNTTPPENADTPWHLFGSDAITIPANTQKSLTIKAVNGDLEVEIDGVTATYTDTYSFTAETLLNKDIVIVSGEYQIIGVGQKISLPEIVYNFDVTADWGNIQEYPVTDQTSFELFLSERSYSETNNLTDIVISDFELIAGRLRCNLTANGTILDLSSIGLTEVNRIGNLPQLEIFEAGENQIVTFNPTIALPSSLLDLNLSYNQIVTFNPTIALPNNLQTLSLYNNQIVTFNPTIALPNNLQTLYLQNNQIVTFNPTIALPNNLQNLYLHINQMTTGSYTTMETWANGLADVNGGVNNNVFFSGNIDSVNGTNLKTILESKGWIVNV